MGFMESILKCISSGPFPKQPPYRILLLGDAGYFENVKSIVSYSADKIVLLVKNNSISICGEQLIIKKFCEGDVIICGKITSVTKA